MGKGNIKLAMVKRVLLHKEDDLILSLQDINTARLLVFCFSCQLVSATLLRYVFYERIICFKSTNKQLLGPYLSGILKTLKGELCKTLLGSEHSKGFNSKRQIQEILWDLTDEHFNHNQRSKSSIKRIWLVVTDTLLNFKL